MANDLNQCNFIGRLTKDPEQRALPSGKAVVNFSIAVNGYKDAVEYVNLVAFDKPAEIIGQHMKKGSRMFVSAQFKMKRWEKDGQKHAVPEFVIRDFQFLDSKADAPKPQSEPDNYDDEIPF